MIIILMLFLCFMPINEGRIRIGRERTGIVFLKGGYRAYWIRYSNGVWMTTPPKNLWCFPRYESCDVRPFLKSLKAPEGKK